jgi:hypothetical protein
MTKVWDHVEFGHHFEVFEVDEPGPKGRRLRLYDNGSPAYGGQWHYTLENAKERAEYLTMCSYVDRIEYLEQRVQALESELAR